MFNRHCHPYLAFMISVEPPSRWVRLILNENICKSLEKTTPLPSIKILDPSDARSHQERSIVLTSHSLSSSMDEHALKPGPVSPSTNTRRRARAPTRRHHLSTQLHPPPPQGDLESPRHSGSRSPFRVSCVTNTPPYRVFTKQGSDGSPSCASHGHASRTFAQPSPFEL